MASKHTVRVRVTYVLVVKDIDGADWEDAAHTSIRQVREWFQERHRLQSPPEPLEPSELRIDPFRVIPE